MFRDHTCPISFDFSNPKRDIVQVFQREFVEASKV
jgi:hypothetical protein